MAEITLRNENGKTLIDLPITIEDVKESAFKFHELPESDRVKFYNLTKDITDWNEICTIAAKMRPDYEEFDYNFLGEIIQQITYDKAHSLEFSRVFLFDSDLANFMFIGDRGENGNLIYKNSLYEPIRKQFENKEFINLNDFLVSLNNLLIEYYNKYVTCISK